jgi:hypothetical protein
MINPLAFIALAAIPLYRWADRRVGSGGANVLGPLGGRSVGFLGGALLGAAIGYVAVGLWGALLGPFWALYRSLDFKRGALTPIDGRERVNAALRHALALLIAVPIFFLGGSWITALVVMAVYAVVASLLAFDLGDRLIACNRDGGAWNDEWNNGAERSRGTAYGVAFAVLCLWGALW